MAPTESKQGLGLSQLVQELSVAEDRLNEECRGGRRKVMEFIGSQSSALGDRIVEPSSRSDFYAQECSVRHGR